MERCLNCVCHTTEKLQIIRIMEYTNNAGTAEYAEM